MSRSGRRDYIHALRRADALPRKNILRLVLPHTDVVAALDALGNATADQMKRRYFAKYSQSIIRDNWDVKPRFSGDSKCLAAIVILSEATPGQFHVVGEILYDQWKTRVHRIGETAPRDTTLTKEDVIAVLNALYKQADALGSVWPEKTLAGKGDKIQKAKVRKVEGVKKRMRDNEEDELGVEYLVVKLKVAQALDESDEDEDEDEGEEYRVRAPGRH